MKVALLLAACLPAFCQDTTTPPSVREKWHFFLEETGNPLTPGAAAFNASISQMMNTDPRYGVDKGAFAQRFGASTADAVTQNLFEDFVFASAFHEDTRYTRMGPEHGFWSRTGHAVGSAVIAQKDSGGATFNWANAAGTAASAGLSNAYYPPASRTGGAIAIHFGTSFIGAGLGNLEPEFWPDVHHWFKRRFHRPM
jgi:hypothetical protein